MTPFDSLVQCSRRASVWLVCAALPWLGACAQTLTLPDEAAAAAAAVPVQWSTEAQALVGGSTVKADWWQVFNDPVLTQLVDRALKANTSVRGAQAAVQQARALRDQAVAGQGPQVGASIRAQRSRTGDGPYGHLYQAGLDASWEPDVFGGLAAARRASEADLAATQASLGSVRVSMAAEVALSYIEWRGLQARLAIARSNLAAQLETLQITDWRVQAGLASSVDLAQARSASEQTRSQIPSLETSALQALNALAVLTGQSPAAVRDALPDAAVPQPPVDLALAFPADTLLQRPDVRAAEYDVVAAAARVSQSNAARYPTLVLGGSLGLNSPRWSELFDPASLTRALVASISASVFDGGAARARVQAQEALLEKARINLESTLLSALRDVEDALVALQRNRERLQHLTVAADAAAQAELLARHRYSSGLIDFRTVLDTQRNLLSVQSELEAAKASLSAGHVRLYKALGGGWQTASASSDLTPSAQE